MSEVPFVRSYSFGDTTIAVITDGHNFYGLSNLFPAEDVPQLEAHPDVVLDADGRAALGVNVALIRTGAATIICDPAHIGSHLKQYPHYLATPGLFAGLQQLHIDLSEVTHVLVSHADLTHSSGLLIGSATGGRPAFPNADVILNEGEADQMKLPRLEPYYRPYSLAGRVRLVGPNFNVTENVTLVHTGGESPGHAVTRVTADQAEFFFLGDLVHFPGEFEDIRIVPSNRDRPQAVEGRRRILEEAAKSDSTLLFFHGIGPELRHSSTGPCGKVVQSNSSSWNWRYV